MPDRPLDYADDLDLLPSDTPNKALEQVAAAEAVRSLDELLARGKERGSVTQEEIMQLVPRAEENVDQLDEIIEALAKAGITITDELVEENEFGADVEPEPVILSEDAPSGHESSTGDTVRMYLHEIGRY